MDPITNLFILFASGFFIWLAHRFAAPNAATLTQKRFVVAFLGFFALLLGINALFAYQAVAGLSFLITQSPLTTLTELARHAPGSEVIVTGHVSENNAPAYQKYVIYRECPEDWPCTVYEEPPLLVALSGGDVAISNTDYEPRNWPGELGFVSTSYLEWDTPLVIVGRIERGQPSAAQPEVAPPTRLNAGSHADFVARAARNCSLPLVLVAVNGVAVLFTLTLTGRRAYTWFYGSG